MSDLGMDESLLDIAEFFHKKNRAVRLTVT
jgi:hypothetical protein